jgi:GNAT superfamily N-acetyltransferase
MPQFVETNAPPAKLRQAYLDGLREPQELYLERLVSGGRTWCYDDSAYAVVNEGRLVEFFVAESQMAQLIRLFDEAMLASGATEIFCKSFDTQLLSAALSRSAHVNTIGFLFRRIANLSFDHRGALTLRSGSTDDAEVIAKLDDGFFDGVGEIRDYAKAGGLVVLYLGSEIVGCGISVPVVAGRPDVDIGMWIAPSHRRKGYGAHIVSYLKRHYLDQGLRPICGCDTENLVSYRTLVAGRFASEHQIFRIVRQT